jgi:hypothetical protein
MPKFSTHVALMNPEYQPANFAPGDEVPDWAIGQVGAHVLEPEAAETGPDESGEDADKDPGLTDDEESKDSDDGDDDSGEESADSAADDQPDFTAPAPARRNARSRK